ncbi:MAG: type 4a pilus biogenesis protein PilO [Deltaproteobacteria bacterium]|nr:type 4a pilus biogenesis protein PilO [Deltaproteobacteria bacterium]
MAPALDVYLKWPTRSKVMLWTAFCAVVGLLYYFLGFMPRLQELRQLDETYARLGKEQRENQAIADNLALVKEEVRRLDQNLAQALEKLPNTEEIPNLLRMVSDLGKEAGLEFLLFKPAPPVPKEFYAEVPLEMQVLGRYHDIAQFIDRVGKLPRIVTIQDLELGGAKPAPGGVKLTASCKATTFKFLDPAEKAALDKAKAAAAAKANGGAT